MTGPDRERRDDDRASEMSSPEGRRRARMLIPGGFLLATVLIFAFILLVSRCGADNPDDDALGAAHAPVAAALGALA